MIPDTGMVKERHIDFVVDRKLSVHDLETDVKKEEHDPHSAKRFIKSRKVHDPIAAAFICQTLCLEQDIEHMQQVD